MALIGTQTRRLTQRYVKVTRNPHPGGSIVASDDPHVAGLADRPLREYAASTDAFMIEGHDIGLGIQPGGTRTVVNALVAQGYRVLSRTDRETVLELVDTNAVEDAGESCDVVVSRPPTMALGRWAQRLSAARKR